MSGLRSPCPMSELQMAITQQRIIRSTSCLVLCKDRLASFNLTAHELHEVYYDIGLLLREALDRLCVRLNMYLVIIIIIVVVVVVVIVVAAAAANDEANDVESCCYFRRRMFIACRYFSRHQKPCRKIAMHMTHVAELYSDVNFCIVFHGP